MLIYGEVLRINDPSNVGHEFPRKLFTYCFFILIGFSVLIYFYVLTALCLPMVEQIFLLLVKCLNC